MSNCYVFSNCFKSSPDDMLMNLRRMNFNENDVFVFLNDARILYKNLEFFKKFPELNLIMRSCSCLGIEGYFGYNLAFTNRFIFKSVMGLSVTADSLLLNVGLKGSTRSNHIELKDDMVAKYTKDTGLRPTTGFAAYYIAESTFKRDHTYLVNFFGNDDNSTCKDASHAWQYENEWLKTRERLFV